MLSPKFFKYFFKVAVYTLLAGFLLYGLQLLARVYICDKFTVPSGSMVPTLIPGDRILVNKRIFGARIYDKFDFSEGAPLVSHRLKGKRGIQPNDIVVFNFPLSPSLEKVAFKINYVYVKRCIGTPGDSVSIINGDFKNNRYSGDLGIPLRQRELSFMDSLYIAHISRALGKTLYKEWSLLNFGPLYIPAAGSRIPLNEETFRLYRLYIEWETGQALTGDGGGTFYLGGKPLDSYVFTRNYYFMCGDNVPASYDSRFWGLVPEDFIVGVVSRILYSKDKYNGSFVKSRFFRKMEYF